MGRIFPGRGICPREGEVGGVNRNTTPPPTQREGEVNKEGENRSLYPKIFEVPKIPDIPHFDKLARSARLFGSFRPLP